MHCTPQQDHALYHKTQPHMRHRIRILKFEPGTSARVIQCAMYTYIHTLITHSRICIYILHTMHHQVQRTDRSNVHPARRLQKHNNIPRCRTRDAAHCVSKWTRSQFSFQFSSLSRLIQVDICSYSNKVPTSSVTGQL